MRNNDSLNVWYGQDLVGTLWRNIQGIIGFRYSKEWLSSPKKFHISYKLPLQDDDFLPEGELAHNTS